jgi:hypothetical protein
MFWRWIWLAIEFRNLRALQRFFVLRMALTNRSMARSLSSGAGRGRSWPGRLRGTGEACWSNAALILRTVFRSCRVVRPYASTIWFQVSGSPSICMIGNKTGPKSIPRNKRDEIYCEHEDCSDNAPIFESVVGWIQHWNKCHAPIRNQIHAISPPQHLH